MKSKATGIQQIDSADEGLLWDLKINPQTDANGMITSGLVIGATLPQNVANLLAMFPGEVKSEPTLGVGLNSELLNENLLGVRHRIREVFPRDGLRLKKLDLYDLTKMKIEADYE